MIKFITLFLLLSLFSGTVILTLLAFEIRTDWIKIKRFFK